MEENLIIPELFSEAVSKFPDKTALQIKRDNHWLKVTYKDLERRSLNVAAFLIKEGLSKSDKACIILENRPEWAIIYFGITYTGATCVPLDAQLSQQEIKNLVIDSGAKIIFCSNDIFIRLRAENHGCKPVDECEQSALRRMSPLSVEGGPAEAKRRRVIPGTAAVKPRGSIKKIKDNINEGIIKIVILDMPHSEEGNFINFSGIEDIFPDKAVMPSILSEDIASLIYTSGTTAEPKGVLLSHSNICSNFRSIAKLNFCLPSDNMISILPLHHTYAFTVTLVMPLFLGATVTYAASLKSQELSQAIEEAEVTILVGVPQLFSILHKSILERLKKIPAIFFPFVLFLVRNKVRRLWGKQLRLMASGGARLEPEIARDLTRLFGLNLIEGYGLTETSPVVTLNPPQRLKFGSVGKPIPDVQIKILNPDKSGIGEVLIKGPNVMQGYFKHQEWTSEAIKEGWFRSGDLGYIDSEGYLFLVGRQKEVIVLSSGKNIYPEELEEHYSKSPYIKEICIIARREEQFGRPVEVLHAIVVPNLDYFKQKNETDIRGKIRWELENLGRALPGYKHLMGFTETKEGLPRTALRKIKRYQVKEKYLSRIPLKPDAKEMVFSEDDLKILQKDAAKKVIDYISGELRKPVYLDSHLEMDLGIDSLSRVELGLGLEQILKIKLPDDLFYSVSTVRELIISTLDLMGKPESAGVEGVSARMNWKDILAKPPKEEVISKMTTRPGLGDKLTAWILKGIFLLILSLFWNLKIKGKKNLPLNGPYLICPNHASYLDPFSIFSSLPFGTIAHVFFLGYSDIVKHPMIRWAIKVGRIIPIDPTTNFIEAMQALSFVLSQKKVVCVFPEGRRFVDENVGEFKKGAGILIKELNIPVVPVYIKGSHRSWPRTSRFPRFHPIGVIFGHPLSAKELLEKKVPGKDDYETIASNLREEVLRLA